MSTDPTQPTPDQPTPDQPTPDAAQPQQPVDAATPPVVEPEQPEQPERPAAPVDAEQAAAEESELERVKAELAAAQEKLRAVNTPSGSAAPDPERSSDELVQEVRDNWPQEGGLPGVPQPWDLKGLGLDQQARELDPGAPNDVAPIVVSHSVPILTFGSADQSVHEIGRMLGQLGFANSVSVGENPFGHVDASVMAAVAGFRNKFGVVPDPSGFGGDHAAGRDLAASHIDPWTVEAIYRVYDRECEPRTIGRLEREIARA